MTTAKQLRSNLISGQYKIVLQLHNWNSELLEPGTKNYLFPPLPLATQTIFIDLLPITCTYIFLCVPIWIERTLKKWKYGLRCNMGHKRLHLSLLTNYCDLQIKHQLDATLCMFYFCSVTLHVSGIKRSSSGVLKNGTPVGHHITIIWWCDDLPATTTSVPGAAVSVFLILLMMGACRPKHVEWLCRNKTCTVLHQFGVLFDLYWFRFGAPLWIETFRNALCDIII